MPDLSKSKREQKKANIAKAQNEDLEIHEQLLKEKILQDIFSKDSKLQKAGSNVIKNIRAKSTMTAYNRVVKDFKKFCLRYEYSFEMPDAMRVKNDQLSL